MRLLRRSGTACGGAVALLAALAAAAGPASAARPATATPVGPLPAGPVSTVAVARGALFAVALPRPKASTGLVWRLARDVSTKVAVQVGEAEVGSSLVVVYRATGRGQASIRFAQTKGDASSKAVRSATTKVTVR